jgi:uncharacterized protein (DUF433 family)
MATHQQLARERFESTDARDIPAYSVADASHYLIIPEATVRSWVQGGRYRVAQGLRRFKPVIARPSQDSPLLSFFNLAEAHVLRSLRTTHGLTLRHIRQALDYVRKTFGWPRPLIQQEFQTDGVSLFVERLGRLIDATAQGQTVMRQIVDAHLQRLEWEDRVVARLYPFTKSTELDSPKTVLIDPRFSFGRPMLRESRVATAVIAERYKAGESVDELAHDYDCTRLEIEEAVRCELRVPAAA